ncbi:FAD-dependent oxidoreductase [Methylobacterium organophilum]|uniref:NAD(P)/FAD-dependent oxidoreductase n=1 Tax=Methylobacterium organophilum TaxID=410 RepID=UPI001F12E2F6|nr:FAD-dependent oxidoreductase [Methylobacterium organophilum]UMY16756.1 FAD-dependent oxidoreductase [Methylobacterium organophilum]
MIQEPQGSARRGKVLVVGSGIAGLSTAWALVRRGFSVEVFEQGQIPHAMASSYDEHRITRHAYGDFPGYARLMPEAFAAYEALWSDLGVRHFEALPLVVLMREPVTWFQGSRTSMDELEIGYRDIPLGALADRYPMIEPEGVTGAYEADGAGMLFPIRILTDLVVHLAARGVRFHPGSPVTEVDAEQASVRVGAQVHRGDAVVVAAGAWVDRLVPDLRGVAVASRQAVAFVAPPVELADAWARAPIFIDLGLESGTYTLPPRPGTRLKLGDHQFTRQGDPDGNRLATDEDVARLYAAARLSYRDFDRYTVLERKACFYTVTEDEAFIAKAIGAKGYVLSACSGHGFKFGPLMGEGVARVIAGERSAADLPAWAAGR